MDRRAFLAGAASLPLATALPAPVQAAVFEYTELALGYSIPAGVFTDSYAWCSGEELFEQVMKSMAEANGAPDGMRGA